MLVISALFGLVFDIMTLVGVGLYSLQSRAFFRLVKSDMMRRMMMMVMMMMRILFLTASTRSLLTIDYGRHLTWENLKSSPFFFTVLHSSRCNLIFDGFVVFHTTQNP